MKWATLRRLRATRVVPDNLKSGALICIFCRARYWNWREPISAKFPARNQWEWKFRFCFLLVSFVYILQHFLRLGVQNLFSYRELWVTLLKKTLTTTDCISTAHYCSFKISVLVLKCTQNVSLQCSFFFPLLKDPCSLEIHSALIGHSLSLYLLFATWNLGTTSVFKQPMTMRVSVNYLQLN